MDYDKLREWLSEKEHEQWMYWSKDIAKKLDKIKSLCYIARAKKAIFEINVYLTGWKKNWIPYKILDEETKDSDREWADKILYQVPFKCPVYQCGGLMIAKERELPKDFIEGEHYDGDDQTPDLICDNCGAVYQFKELNNEN